MAGTLDILKIVQQAAVEACEAGSPANVAYGVILSVSPLSVKTREGFTIPAAALELCRNVTDYNIETTIDEEIKQITIHNALKVGDHVAMVKAKGGQSYLILDRVVV